MVGRIIIALLADNLLAVVHGTLANRWGLRSRAYFTLLAIRRRRHRVKFAVLCADDQQKRVASNPPGGWGDDGENKKISLQSPAGRI